MRWATESKAIGSSEARKISDPLALVKSARHKAQRIVLTENALAVIDRKGRWCARE